MKFFFFPYGESFKNISVIREFWGKKGADSIQHQCFSKSAWAGNQCYLIKIFPPFFDEFRFINVEGIIFPKKGKTLCACRNLACHDVLRLRARCWFWIGLFRIIAVQRLLLKSPYHELPALGNAMEGAGRLRRCL